MKTRQTHSVSDKTNDSGFCGENDVRVDVLKDGGLMLGRGYPRVEPYVTKYHINHTIRGRSPCWIAVSTSLCPCLTPEASVSCAEWLGACLRSWILLVFLCLSTLGLGISKEALQLRHSQPRLHTVQTVFELVAATAYILLQIFSVYGGQRAANEALARAEYMENKARRYRKSGRWFKALFTLYCLLTIGIIIGATVLLQYFVHLGWTPLVVLPAILMTSAMQAILERRDWLLASQVISDHHKLVLEECALLLKEGLCYRGWVNREYIQRANRFLRAVAHSEEFDKPKHIEIDSRDNLTLFELESTV